MNDYPETLSARIEPGGACADIALGGVFSFILIVAIPLAVVFTWTTVFWYRRKVAKTMRQLSGAQTAADEVSDHDRKASDTGRKRLALNIVTASDSLPNTLVSSSISRQLRKTTLAYAVAGVTQAMFVSVMTLYLSNDDILPFRFFTLVMLYLWPVVPCLLITSVGDSRVKWASLVGYFGIVFSVEWFLQATGIMQNAHTGALLLVWLTWMGPPTLLLLIFSNRAWRAVGLFAYWLCVALVGGWLASTQWLACLALDSGNIALWTRYHWPTRALSIVLSVALAWWVLRFIAERYRNRRFSDQFLTLLSWWLLITLVEIVIQFDATQGRSISFIIGFGLFYIISRTLLSRQQLSAPHSLLLLRVFGHQRRTRKLLDQLNQRWRVTGPIHLIGAPDVATTNIETDDLILFWAGKGKSLFVASEQDLQHRLESLPETPDPDGYYRTNEFFCYDNTWRNTVKALSKRSDKVLMDLREFGPDNRGCAYELELLMTEIPLDRWILLIDGETDLHALEVLLNQIWSNVPEPGINTSLAAPTLTLFKAKGSMHSIQPLIRLLSAAKS